MSEDIKMYSLLQALNEVRNAYAEGKESITLRCIHPNCAKRVSECFEEGKITLKHFTKHKEEYIPCTTFTFSYSVKKSDSSF